MFENIILDWLSLILRWAHVIVGIAWIGSSFYFMWLDSHLEEPVTPDDDVEGQLWMVHSGGFYRVDKIMVAPRTLPKNLHWFKWEAWWTGVTGILLLAVVYYFGSQSFLIDPDVSNITKTQAIWVGVGTLILGWVLYDALYSWSWAQANGNAAAILSFLALCGIIFGLCELLSPRAAYIHTGALVGLVMVVNVWRRILPAQQKLIDAKLAGVNPDPSQAQIAKQRSVHNNYLTLPVVFIMISSHYPATFGHQQNWAVLIGLFVIGALVRHWFNLRNSGTPSLWPLIFSIVFMCTLATWISLPKVTSSNKMKITRQISLDEVSGIIAVRCRVCHASKPSFVGFDSPPKNIKFESTGQIKKYASQIWKTTVATESMPLGNVTKMTKKERKIIGRWIEQGLND